MFMSCATGGGREVRPTGKEEGMKKARILVVEDEAIIAKDIGRRLEKHGYEVSATVSTGGDAVRRAGKDEPDLVLMDIVLPGDIDGIDAAGIIRSRNDIPVVYLTAYTNEAIIERAIRTEPFGYITKPFEDSELCRTIEMALFKHRMEREVRESEEWLATTLRSIGEAVVATDREGAVRFMNPVAEAITGWSGGEAAGRPVTDVFRTVGGEEGGEQCCPATEALREGSTVTPRGDCTLLARDGREIAVTSTGAPIIEWGGKIIGAVLVFRDVTEEKKAARELTRSREEIERKAEEIRERNTALKVLLEQREQDRLEFEEKVLANISHLVLPYVDRLKKSRLPPEERECADLLRSNLEQITSAFSARLSSSLVGLSPQEIRVAGLVREGKQDKEITEVLNISFETVKTHKQNIRKKLGIYGQRKNLRSFLDQYAD
jgi:PAS domain S-box-containing protein